jgi:hypothetical protein
MHTGGGGGDLLRGDKSVTTLPNFFKTFFFYENAIKHQKGVPTPKKFGKNLMDPPPGFSNRVHLCFRCKSMMKTKTVIRDLKINIELLTKFKSNSSFQQTATLF